MIVDSRAGFSDESGICTRDLADALFVLSGLNAQNVEGTSRFLAALRAADGPGKPLAVVLSPIPNGEDALVDAREARAQAAFSEAWGKEVQTDPHIPNHPQLALTEEPHIFRRRRGYLFDVYHRVERRLLELIGETWEQMFDAVWKALDRKDSAGAMRRLRLVAHLGNASEWGDYFVYSGLAERLAKATGTGDGLYELVAENASSDAQRWLVERLLVEASRRDRPERLEERSALFQLAVRLSPSNVTVLGEYAFFLWTAARCFDDAEAVYQKALELEPDHALIVSDYAMFRSDVHQDYDGAEKLFERAMKSRPASRFVLPGYAVFKEVIRRQDDEAEQLHRAAVAADEQNANARLNYAGFLFHRDRRQEAELLLSQAGPYLSHPEQRLEACFYRYVYGLDGAANARRALVEGLAAGDRSRDFGLIRHVEWAVANDHPDAIWIAWVARVIADEIPFDVPLGADVVP